MSFGGYMLLLDVVAPSGEAISRQSCFGGALMEPLSLQFFFELGLAIVFCIWLCGGSGRRS